MTDIRAVLSSFRAIPLAVFTVAVLSWIGCASDCPEGFECTPNEDGGVTDVSVTDVRVADAGVADGGEDANALTDVTIGVEDARVDAEAMDGATDASPDAGPGESRLVIADELLDDAMGLPVPVRAGTYEGAASGGGGPNYGKNAAGMLFLTLVGRNDPTRTDTNGDNVSARAVEHLQAALNPTTHPRLTGGHHSWSNMFVPISLGLARHTPSMWSQLSTDEQSRADLLMRQALYSANIFCNTNSEDPNERSRVQVDMKLLPSGSLPNQSASFHAFAIGSYIYFGGTAGMNRELAAYDYQVFQRDLRAVGFDSIADLYNRAELRRMLDGETIEVRGRPQRPDPMGVRKPFLELNTYSLLDTASGEEHPFHSNAVPVPATPPRIFERWGHDFAVGSTPLTNVGPSNSQQCDGSDFGLVMGTMPFDGQPGRGMPYEFNARGGTSGPPSRSSWDYSAWSMQQYMYMFAAVTMAGYWDMSDPRDQEIWARARRAVEIIRYVGENKWLSNAGPTPQVCTSNHGDAYHEFNGMHWAQGLMDTLFSAEFSPPSTPIVE